MKIKENVHHVKIKVHNTKCSLDVQGFHDESNKRFEHLDNYTVGEYFAHNIITHVVNKINNTVDIQKLNDHLRLLATEGKKHAKSKSKVTSCKVCDKDIKKESTLKCQSCHEHVHSACLAEKTAKCGHCVVYPSISLNKKGKNIDYDLIDTLKQAVILPVEQSTEQLDPGKVTLTNERIAEKPSRPIPEQNSEIVIQMYMKV